MRDWETKKHPNARASTHTQGGGGAEGEGGCGEKHTERKQCGEGELRRRPAGDRTSRTDCWLAQHIPVVALQRRRLDYGRVRAGPVEASHLVQPEERGGECQHLAPLLRSKGRHPRRRGRPLVLHQARDSVREVLHGTRELRPRVVVDSTQQAVGFEQCDGFRGLRTTRRPELRCCDRQAASHQIDGAEAAQVFQRRQI